jgi:hypothetical protein
MTSDQQQDDLRKQTIEIASHLKGEQVFVSRHQPALFYNGQTIPLDPQREYVLGRDRSTCDIIINDARASRHHAKIYSRGGRYFIQDLGSMNGTFVNRERITQPTGLLPGDEIVVPPKKLLFVLHDEQISQQTDRFVTAAAKPQSQFSGVLHALRIADLIQLLNSTKQSGMLTIHDADQQIAKLYFVKGEIKRAEYKTATREEAVYEVLRIRDGSFEFVRQDIEMPATPIESRTISMLLEGCRRADEKLDLSEDSPSP